MSAPPRSPRTPGAGRGRRPAGAGLGAAIARRFGAEGAKVVVSDINLKAAEQVAATIDGALAIVSLDQFDEKFDATEDVEFPAPVEPEPAPIEQPAEMETSPDTAVPLVRSMR